MTSFTLTQIKKAITKGMATVSAHFARDPKPTNGSVCAGTATATAKSKRAAAPKKKPANTKRRKRH